MARCRASAARRDVLQPRKQALALRKSCGSSSSTSRPGARLLSNPCSTASACAWLRALVRTFRPRAEWSSVTLQLLIARGTLASAKNAVAVGECTSGVSTASSTQVST